MIQIFYDEVNLKTIHFIIVFTFIFYVSFDLKGKNDIGRGR